MSGMIWINIVALFVHQNVYYENQPEYPHCLGSIVFVFLW